jgi:hypothetical protein
MTFNVLTVGHNLFRYVGGVGVVLVGYGVDGITYPLVCRAWCSNHWRPPGVPYNDLGCVLR